MSETMESKWAGIRTLAEAEYEIQRVSDEELFGLRNGETFASLGEDQRRYMAARIHLTLSSRLLRRAAPELTGRLRFIAVSMLRDEIV